MASVYITYMCGHTEKAYFEGSVKAATRKAEYRRYFIKLFYITHFVF